MRERKTSRELRKELAAFAQRRALGEEDCAFILAFCEQHGLWSLLGIIDWMDRECFGSVRSASPVAVEQGTKAYGLVTGKLFEPESFVHRSLSCEFVRQLTLAFGSRAQTRTSDVLVWYCRQMEFWHLTGRGVEKRDVVLDDQDRIRFLHNLYVFNDENPAPNFVLPSRHEGERGRACLVDIHAFCLMTNHYHLLVTECIESGVALFMQKLNMGYTKYFNERYNRSGALWQGKYRRVLIERDAHFLYIPFYIHLNPLDYAMPEWREGTVRDLRSAFDVLKTYRWSSYLDYRGEHNFPSITRRDFLGEVIGSSAAQEETIANIIGDGVLAGGGSIIEYQN